MPSMKPGAPAAEDDAEYLSDEFVLDDAPARAPAPEGFIIFAGPSDAPPAFTPVRPPGRPVDRRWPYGLGGVAVGLGIAAIAFAWWSRSGAPAAAARVAPSAANVATESPGAAVVVPPERIDAVQPSEPPAPSAQAASVAASEAPATADGAGAKHASQAALEKGRTAEAISLGERSVALDPTDAEAWLVLGAAYDQRKDYAKACATFKSCVDQATRGPRGECAALLR